MGSLSLYYKLQQIFILSDFIIIDLFRSLFSYHGFLRISHKQMPYKIFLDMIKILYYDINKTLNSLALVKVTYKARR